jgi:hypothetical protein
LVSDANLDSPSAIETPKLPPPMMYFHTSFGFPIPNCLQRIEPIWESIVFIEFLFFYKN